MRKFVITGVQFESWNRFINGEGRGSLYSITKENSRYIVTTNDENVVDFCEMRYKEL